MPFSLYRREDDSPTNTTRGRHLVATQAIEKGTLIFCERPLLALQSLGTNTRHAWICHACKAFVGGPHAAMQRRFITSTGTATTTTTTTCGEEVIIPCRQGCGHVYCSVECEQDAWSSQHQWLCTGACSEEEEEKHPLVQFKQYAVETNEILLLVAEWWVAQHCSSSNDDDGHDDSTKNKYTDFCMEPWWDVETLDLKAQPGGFSKAFALQQQLEDICQQAATLLTQALVLSPSSTQIPAITARDVAVRIGACAQNAIGVRQRHPLCRDLFEPEFRHKWHAQIIRALEEAGFVGDDDDDDNDDASDNCMEETAAAPASANGGEVGLSCDDDGDGDDDDDKLDDDPSAPPPKSSTYDDNENPKAKRQEEGKEEWDYTEDEIAAFLSNLFVDEDGTVLDINNSNKKSSDDNGSSNRIDRVRDTQGDDLDYVFPPLDGTAMYATACKMNHSCDPNVIVLYKRTGYGSRHPLTAFCVALKDIRQGEELTISYIENDKSYEERQKALVNYGFACSCPKCEVDAAGGTTLVVQSKQSEMEDDLFGAADEDDDDEKDADADKPPDDDGNEGEKTADSNDVNASNDASATDEKETNGELALQQLLDRLDSASNHSRFGSVPLPVAAQVLAYVIQNGAALSQQQQQLDNLTVKGLLSKCVNGARERDFCMCKIAGCDLENTLFELLRRHGSWPNVSYREVYWCAVLSCAIGLAHECCFLEAMSILDKGMILGLPRRHSSLHAFVDYVEVYSSQVARGPSPPAISSAVVPDYRTPELKRAVVIEGLMRPIEFGIEERTEPVGDLERFQSDFVTSGKPVVIRGYTSDWEAADKFRDLRRLTHQFGHRLLPIEVGSMMPATGQQKQMMKEELFTVRQFATMFLAPSTEKGCWSLADAVNPSSRVAYMAQHPLLDQIPSLCGDDSDNDGRCLQMRPDLCGPTGPSQINVWLGTGGTRTPLHFDSYDNLLVQLVGVKYVRLYASDDDDETPRLLQKTLAVNASYGLQGNMSQVDCECEEWERYPEDIRNVKYSETVLFPGDCLFIPARMWHYVRSLTTSFSVNYWFDGTAANT